MTGLKKKLIIALLSVTCITAGAIRLFSWGVKKKAHGFPAFSL